MKRTAGLLSALAFGLLIFTIYFHPDVVSMPGVGATHLLWSLAK